MSEVSERIRERIKGLVRTGGRADYHDGEALFPPVAWPERYVDEEIARLIAERDELRAWGRQIHDALDGRPLPGCPDEAPARIARLTAERDALDTDRRSLIEDLRVALADLAAARAALIDVQRTIHKGMAYKIAEEARARLGTGEALQVVRELQGVASFLVKWARPGLSDVRPDGTVLRFSASDYDMLLVSQTNVAALGNALERFKEVFGDG